MTYLEMGQYEQARRFLERTLLVAGPQQSHVPKAFALLIQALTELGRHDDAWQGCQHGLHPYANDPELLFRAEVLAHHFGRFDEAERYYLQLLATRCDQVYRSIDRGICGYKARHNLALVYMDQGRYEAAEPLWQVILKDHPSSPEAWRGLITSLLQQDKVVAAAARLSNARALLSLPGLRLQLDAQLDTHNADYEAASAKLEQAVKSCPHDFEARNALCRLLFEHGDPHQAERAHVQLAGLRQDDPCVHHNLGQIYLRLNLLEDALKEFRAADRLRPNCPDILAHLALAHELLGDIREPCEPHIHPRSVSLRGEGRRKDSRR